MKLGAEAAWAAVQDASISPKDLQFAYCANLYGEWLLTGRSGRDRG